MNYKDINDFEVLYLVEENQSEYKNVIFEKYKPILKSLSYSYYTKLKNYGYEYEDCYQEALIGLNYAIDNFKFERNVIFYTYATLCIKSRLNSFLNISLGNKNKILNESIYSYSNIFNYFDNTLSTSFDSMYLSFYEKILRFKNSLSDIQSQIFELKYNGFSNREIGELLSIHPRVVYNNICLIRDRMKISNFSIK